MKELFDFKPGWPATFGGIPALKDLSIPARCRRVERIEDADGAIVLGHPTCAPGATIDPSEINGVRVDPYIGWGLTYPINYTGHPAASVPGGLDADGMPVGLQVIGRRGRDTDVIAACGALEQVRPWAQHYPG